MNFKEIEAEQTLNQSFSMFPIEAVCVEVLQKGLSEIGNLWYQNQASVQQEHFASGLAMRRLDALLMASPAPSRPFTVLVGCPANEWHTFTALMLALFLRRRGFHVIYLGANVPTARFEETIQSVRANLVILAAQTLTSAASLQQVGQALSSKDIHVGYGGRIFNLHPELISSIPGHHLGNDVAASVDEVETILNGKRKRVQVKSSSQDYVAALQFFLAKRPDIEMTLRTLMEPPGISSEGYQTGIQFLGDNITAALSLGDIYYASDEIEWIQNLLHAHARPNEELIHFIDAYAQALNRHLNGSGRLIYEWLRAKAEELQAK